MMQEQELFIKSQIEESSGSLIEEINSEPTKPLEHCNSDAMVGTMVWIFSMFTILVIGALVYRIIRFIFRVHFRG